MPGGAIAAIANLGLPTRARALYVNGLDVALEQGPNGNKYGTQLETLQLVEAGPGGVSSMTFTIDDPQLEVVIVEGAVVELRNLAKGIPEFLGIVQTWTVRPIGVGRQLEVICQGIEAALDSRWIASLTIPAGLDEAAAIQVAYAVSVGSWGIPLRAIAGSSFAQSSWATPLDNQWILAYDVVLANVTLRQAIRSILAAAVGPDSAAAGYWIAATVDYWTGLRAFTELQNIGGPADYLTVAISTAGTTRPADQQHTTDAGGAMHAAWVTGGSPAGSGLVNDGTGLPGKIGQVSDSTSTTAAQRDAVGLAFLRDKTIAFRGSVRLEEPSFEAVLVAGATEVHPGGQLSITDPQLGLAAASFQITQITKRLLPSGRFDWTFRYGGTPPHATRLIRRYTSRELR